jgi:hypothetical protein
MNLKTYTLILLALTISITVSSQDLKVVKDNISCTYGLKNQQDEWVVPATYNYILEGGVWQKLSIQDLFGEGDVLLEEYTLALSKRDDLDLDCSNMENIAALLENKWTFSKEGLWIYVKRPYQQQESIQPKLLIPWVNLAKHKETRSIAKRFLQVN